MNRAYDTILLSEVYAVTAEKYGGNEPCRYKCACCGESVNICAADSLHQTTHFRHSVHGNNEKECENYLGSHKTLNTKPRSSNEKNEILDFYYSKFKKIFFIGVKYSEKQIDDFEKDNISFEIYADKKQEPIISKSISRSNFAPDFIEKIPLTWFSWRYFTLNFLNNKEKINYTLFHRKPYYSSHSIYPSFFKVFNNEQDISKLIRGNILYTNTRYLLIFPHNANNIFFRQDVEIHNHFSFRTMENDFNALELTFNNKSFKVEKILKTWGYSLENNECITLLWPPAPLIEEAYVINSDKAYLYTSFKLHAHGNTNLHSTDINQLSNNISNIKLNPITKVIQNNAELTILKLSVSSEIIETIDMAKIHRNKIKIPSGNGTYYIFDNDGTKRLKSGQTVFLTPKTLLKKYNGNYIINQIVKCKPHQIDKQTLLNDIILHYKCNEPLNIHQFDEIKLSDIALKYIDKCKLNNKINSQAKKYIMDGLL